MDNWPFVLPTSLDRRPAAGDKAARCA